MKDYLLKMIKKPIVWVCLALAMAIAIIAVQSSMLRNRKTEISRLETNQASLLGNLEYYQDENNTLTASVQTLTLRRAELETLIPAYQQEIDDLKLKLKNVQSVAHVATENKTEISALITPIPIPTPPKEELPDAPNREYEVPHEFRYSDKWTTISGMILRDSLVNIHIEQRDSLTVVAHKEQKKCRRKSKIIKYTVQSKNPRTVITDVEYIELTE